MSNRSLDDFNTGDDTLETAESPTADANDDRDVSTLATYRWTPDGTTCPACGDTVEKRWLDGDEYVCIECKDW
ncbi:hypothetical protein C440_05228 [Haloferax mucosum ATCC BAA-1512]|uniref:DUF7573 domain-containing protein n=1 Tax=Haloferax mucosum ATCC BAA-1512 TaxID=662479 RepID=M0IL13_9EURY|nr:hypothetical protein [Haloferax mucosum]ELZ96523.1 hypothetical protein C440_05228 [Haloferax mucosum ATCC BAA-1512]